MNISHYKLIEMLRYKAKLRGIKVIITEEYYTSQSSFYMGEICQNMENKNLNLVEKESQ
ncbi:zinc ribbon domain-containing protein [Okeania sp. SIO2C9]|uniref:zinc ribbon domain-containing protein n=1 Tax=Okeania sp. SIO2C9 TaxID=2607791 RepID=UPI00345D78F8